MRRLDADFRAVSPVIGLVLLIGLVAIGSATLLVVGMGAITDAEQYAENERVEQSFVELKKTIGLSSPESDATQSTNLDVGESGAIIKQDTGTISVTYDEAEGSLLEEEITFGTLEYEGNDGSKIAYEAGAVFRETGDETRVVSGPDVHYNEDTNTLNFPILEIVGEEELSSGDLRVDLEDSEGISEVVEDKTVIITIESEYWRGWEQYFVNQVGERGVIAESEQGTDKGTVEVNLGRINVPTPFENAVHAGEDIQLDGNAEIKGDQVIDDSLDSIDDVIEDHIDLATDEETDYEDEERMTGGEYGAGEYYAEEVILEDDLVFDLSDGDVTLVVENDIHVTTDNEFRVENWGENELQIYLGGDLEINEQMCLDNDVCEGAFNDRTPSGDSLHSSELDPERLQVYGTSDFQLTMTGGTYFEGIMYAPKGEDGTSAAEFPGNAYIDGSLVLGYVRASGTPTVDHTDSLKWFDPVVGEATQPPELTYLNLVYHEMEVNRN
ncbi:DUF7289 family protein [Natrononativus amylolyticus]|uniref:DUF7289 family protein n=1 Tax=Natrononativus amylolyticus TaxID=2963434 RepID=UPI0020CC6C2F|nr:hypothetical protein [Natrononativus amylolyticus]